MGYLGNIQWASRIAIPVKDEQEWKYLVQWYNEHGKRVEGLKTKTDLKYWLSENSWNVDRDNNGNCYLYVSRSTLHPEYPIFFKYVYHDKLEKNHVSGRAAWRNLSRLFESRTGETFRTAFGRVSVQDFWGFQYGAISWTNKKFHSQTFSHVYKADISAAYPYQACKMLPDSHDALRLEGRRPPTPEYPFAYYLKSNQLAIYGEFDTRDWIKHPLNNLFIDKDIFIRKQMQIYKKPYDNRFHYMDVPDDQEITLLMKASRYTFRDEFEYLYEKRHEEEIAKQICNIAIGCMSSPNSRVNDKINQRHITSVIYARHNIRMMKLYDRICNLGGKVISVVVDSIAWIAGKDISVGERTKRLGAFFLEYEDAKACYATHGVYAFQTKSGAFKIWHQGYKIDNDFIKSFKKVGDIKKLVSEHKQTVFNRKTGLFTEVYNNE